MANQCILIVAKSINLSLSVTLASCRRLNLPIFLLLESIPDPSFRQKYPNIKCHTIWSAEDKIEFAIQLEFYTYSIVVEPGAIVMNPDLILRAGLLLQAEPGFKSISLIFDRSNIFEEEHQKLLELFAFEQQFLTATFITNFPELPIIFDTRGTLYRSSDLTAVICQDSVVGPRELSARGSKYYDNSYDRVDLVCFAGAVARFYNFPDWQFCSEELSNQIINYLMNIPYQLGINIENEIAKIIPEILKVSKLRISAVDDQILKQPLVSCIIPTINRHDYLEAAIHSILQQTFASFEIIIVNDGGPALPEHLIKQDPRIVSIRHDVNKERSAARNTGLAQARGKYIAYLDDDDQWYPYHLQMLVATAQKYSTPVVYSDSVQSWEKRKNNFRYICKKNIPYSQEFDAGEMFFQNFIPINCLMHEKQCTDLVGNFNEQINRLEDWDLLRRLSRKFAFKRVPAITTEFVKRDIDQKAVKHELLRFSWAELIIKSADTQKVALLENGQLRFDYSIKMACDRIITVLKELLSDLVTDASKIMGNMTQKECLRILETFGESYLPQKNKIELISKLVKADSKIFAELEDSFKKNIKFLQTARRRISSSRNRNCSTMFGKASIVVAVTDDLFDLKKLVQSIVVHTQLESYELIVINNYKKLINQQAISILGDNIRIIHNYFETDLATVFNQGARIAESELIVFMNNVTEVSNNWLQPMVAIMLEDSQIAVVGNKHISESLLQVEHAGVYFDSQLVPKLYQYAARIEDSLQDADRQVQAVSGACVMLRTSAFEELEGFEQNYNTLEIIEFCLRAKTQGYKTFYQPQSAVFTNQSNSLRNLDTDSNSFKNFINNYRSIVKPDLAAFKNSDRACLPDIKSKNYSGKKIAIVVEGPMDSLELLALKSFVKCLRDSVQKGSPEANFYLLDVSNNKELSALELLFRPQYYEYDQPQKWIERTLRKLKIDCMLVVSRGLAYCSGSIAAARNANSELYLLSRESENGPATISKINQKINADISRVEYLQSTTIPEIGKFSLTKALGYVAARRALKLLPTVKILTFFCNNLQDANKIKQQIRSESICAGCLSAVIIIPFDQQGLGDKPYVDLVRSSDGFDIPLIIQNIDLLSKELEIFIEASDLLAIDGTIATKPLLAAGLIAQSIALRNFNVYLHQSLPELVRGSKLAIRWASIGVLMQAFGKIDLARMTDQNSADSLELVKQVDQDSWRQFSDKLLKSPQGFSDYTEISL